ncbi:MAG: hypothetical protein EZS28_021516, partial [Streblomastix strix]
FKPVERDLGEIIAKFEGEFGGYGFQGARPLFQSHFYLGYFTLNPIISKRVWWKRLQKSFFYMIKCEFGGNGPKRARPPFATYIYQFKTVIFSKIGKFQCEPLYSNKNGGCKMMIGSGKPHPIGSIPCTQLAVDEDLMRDLHREAKNQATPDLADSASGGLQKTIL